MSEVSGSIPMSGLCFLLILVVFTLCVARFPGMSASGLGFDSSVRILFSIDLCCIYLVFTMLFIFVKRMYS